MKILVTGATGFIGAAVARKLSQQRHEVLALSRSDAAAAKLRAAGLTPIFGDFAVPSSLAAPAAQVDAIVSAASIGQVEGVPDGFARDRDAVAVMTEALGDSGKPLNLHQRFGHLRGLHQGRGQSDDFRRRPSRSAPRLRLRVAGGRDPRAVHRRLRRRDGAARRNGEAYSKPPAFGESRSAPVSSTARARATTCPISSPWPRRTAPRLIWSGRRSARLRPHRRPGGALRPGP